MPAHDEVWGLVLTGGRSRRMGSDKALLRRDGETQLGRAVRLLGGQLERVYVSTREDQADEEERSKFEQITDRYADLGPLAGIMSAMDFNPDVSWFVVACDLPNVDAETVGHLIRERSGSQPFTAYVSSSDGLPEPLCAIFRPEARPILDDFVAQGVICPRKIMLRSDTRLLTQPNPAALDNVNTPEDLERAGVEIAS